MLSKGSMGTFAAGALGTAAGCALCLVVVPLIARKTDAPTVAVPALVQSAKSASPEQYQIEARLQHLERSAAAASRESAKNLNGSEHDSPPLEPTDTPHPTPSMEEVRFQFEQKLERHRQQPLDRNWAREAAATFEKELRGIASSNGFDFVSIDCRTTTCAARVRWDSNDTLGQGVAEILHAPYKLGCAREIVTPPRGTQPYEASILFDCEEAMTTGTIAKFNSN